MRINPLGVLGALGMAMPLPSQGQSSFDKPVVIGELSQTERDIFDSIDPIIEEIQDLEKAKHEAIHEFDKKISRLRTRLERRKTHAWEAIEHRLQVPEDLNMEMAMDRFIVAEEDEVTALQRSEPLAYRPLEEAIENLEQDTNNGGV